MQYTVWVEKAVSIFRTFAEAERADLEYYRSLTPEQRLEILFEICESQQPGGRWQPMERVGRIVKLGED